MLQFNINPPSGISSQRVGFTFGKEIEMEVVFGTPSQNCLGAGVCYLSKVFPLSQSLPCPHAPAKVRWQNGRLWFEFCETDLRDEKAGARLGGEYFEIVEPFRLPLFMRRRLAIPFEWVKPGRYAIFAFSGRRVIDFGGIPSSV